MGKFLILMIFPICAGMAITFGLHHSKQKLHSNRIWDNKFKKPVPVYPATFLEGIQGQVDGALSNLV